MINGSVSGKYNRFLAIIKLILLVIIVAGIPAFLYLRYGSELFSKDAAGGLVSYLRSNGGTAALLIIAIQVVQIVICFIPGQPLQFASSYMFGVVKGFALSLTGAVIGTVLSFYIAKLLGSDAMHIFFGEDKVSHFKAKLNSGRGLMLAFLIYLIPGIPKDLISYIAGVSDMRFRPFLLVATAGRIPGMIGSLLLGHFFGRQDYRSMMITAAIVAVILIICYIKRKALISFLDEVEKKDMRSGNGSDG